MTKSHSILSKGLSDSRKFGSSEKAEESQLNDKIFQMKFPSINSKYHSKVLEIKENEVNLRTDSLQSLHKYNKAIDSSFDMNVVPQSLLSLNTSNKNKQKKANISGFKREIKTPLINHYKSIVMSNKISIKDQSVNETNNSVIRKSSSITPLEEQLSVFQQFTKSDIDIKHENSNNKETIAQELDILNTKISEILPVNSCLPPINCNINIPEICNFQMNDEAIQTEKRIPELTEENEPIKDSIIDIIQEKEESIICEIKPTQFINKDPILKAPSMFGNSLDVKFVHQKSDIKDLPKNQPIEENKEDLVQNKEHNEVKDIIQNEENLKIKAKTKQLQNNSQIVRSKNIECTTSELRSSNKSKSSDRSVTPFGKPSECNNFNYEFSNSSVLQETSSPHRNQIESKVSSIIGGQTTIANDNSHKRYSSKTTKKLELSVASGSKTNELGLFFSKPLVKAKYNALAFNKKEQRKMRKEFKLRKSQQKFESNQFFNYEDEDNKEVIVDDPNEDYDCVEVPIKEENSSHHSIKESDHHEDAKQEIDQNNYDSKLSVTQIKAENFDESKYKDALVLRSLRNDINSETVSWKGSDNLKSYKDNSDLNMLSKSSQRTDDYQINVLHPKSSRKSSKISIMTPIKSHFKKDPVIYIQRMVRGYLARKEIRWRLENCTSMIKIYQKIINRDDNYYLIQGYINEEEEIDIVVYDIFKKAFTQELTLTKKEYIIMMNEFLRMNIKIPEDFDTNSDNLRLKNLRIDVIDFEYLIDFYLNYDDIIQTFIFQTKQKEEFNRKINTCNTKDRRDSNPFHARSIGTSRSSIITESGTKISAAFKLNSCILSRTTFAKHSDTSKIEEDEDSEDE